MGSTREINDYFFGLVKKLKASHLLQDMHVLKISFSEIFLLAVPISLLSSSHWLCRSCGCPLKGPRSRYCRGKKLPGFKSISDDGF